MAKKNKQNKEREAVQKASDVETIKAAINKLYGKGTIVFANEATNLEIQRIPTGIFDLDLKIGGGIPRDRVTVFKGKESCGKTTVALKALGNFQKCDRITGKPFIKYIDGEWVEVDFGRKGEPQPMRCAWLDFEHCYTKEWSEVWGVDNTEILLEQPEYAEQGLDIADYLIRSRLVDLIVMDSVAAMTPSKEIEGSHEDMQIGLQPRLMAKALRKWTAGMNSGGLLTLPKCTIILINQMRIAMANGVSYLTDPGGNALKHFKDLDINMKRKDFVIDPEADRPVGTIIDYVVDKNKTAATQGTGTFKLYFNNSECLGKRVGETDEEEQIIKLAAYWKIIKAAKNGRFEVRDHKIHGIANLVELFQNDRELLESVKEQIIEYEHDWVALGKAPKKEKKEKKESDEE